MIQIKVYCKDEKKHGFELQGHADYAQNGYDIICSAISALSINCINSITEFTEDVLSHQINDGYLYVYIENPSKETLLLLNSCILGFTNIQNEYGDKYVKLSNQEVK